MVGDTIEDDIEGAQRGRACARCSSTARAATGDGVESLGDLRELPAALGCSVDADPLSSVTWAGSSGCSSRLPWRSARC